MSRSCISPSHSGQAIRSKHVIDWRLEAQAPVRPLGVVPEQVINELLVEELWFIKGDLMLVNEFFLNSSVVLLDIAVHRRFSFEVPVVDEVLVLQIAREIFAELVSVVGLHAAYVERGCDAKTPEEVLCVCGVEPPVAPGERVLRVHVNSRDHVPAYLVDKPDDRIDLDQVSIARGLESMGNP